MRSCVAGMWVKMKINNKIISSNNSPGASIVGDKAQDEVNSSIGESKISEIFKKSLENSQPKVENAAIKCTDHPPQKASELMKYFILNAKLNDLTPTQKQQVINKCVESYKASVQVFETTIGELAAKHPDAKEFSQEMCRRINRIVKAYQEIILENKKVNPLAKELTAEELVVKYPDDKKFVREMCHRIDRIMKISEIKELNPVMTELTIRLGTDVEFATYGDGFCTGSVGFNPIAIEDAMRKGTLREQMLLLNSSIWTALPKIFDDPEMVNKINTKLKGDFQINAELINAKKKSGQGRGEKNPVVIFFAQAEPLAKFRKEGGRYRNPDRPKKTSTKVKDIKNLTIREARATLQSYISEEEIREIKEGNLAGKELGEQRVQWVRGKDLFRLNPNTDFYKKAVKLGSLPIVTGPSGTVDGYLKGIKYLNMQGFEQKAILALMGVLIPEGHHSLHEIREAGTWHNLKYPEGPEAFNNVYFGDTTFQNKMKESMEEQGLQLPGHYLSGEYQIKKSKDFGFKK